MKKLLKSRICGFVNSARIYCLMWKSQQVRTEPKNKSTRQKRQQSFESKRALYFIDVKCDYKKELEERNLYQTRNNKRCQLLCPGKERDFNFC